MAFEAKEFKYVFEKNTLDGREKDGSIVSALEAKEAEINKRFLEAFDFIMGGQSSIGRGKISWNGNDKDLMSNALQALADCATKTITFYTPTVISSYNKIYDSIKPNVDELPILIEEYNNACNQYPSVSTLETRIRNQLDLENSKGEPM